MGSFLNPGTIEFEEALNSEIYIDKSGLIEVTNAVLRTQQKFMCISRSPPFENLWPQICSLPTMIEA